MVQRAFLGGVVGAILVGTYGAHGRSGFLLLVLPIALSISLFLNGQSVAFCVPFTKSAKSNIRWEM